ncbi:MAG: polysaccharide biosynthesis protein [Candidatus Krumholzibacteria bacterium]|nr:polysaccharide biosynthesis protein [Candidatus Krumholzibacteria bacterium]
MIGNRRRKILIVGAGEAARMVASEIACSAEINASVEGFLDDDAGLAHMKVEGFPVLGRTTELESVVAERDIDEIIIAIPTAPGRFVRDIIRRCRRAGVAYKIVPGVMEIIRGTVHIDQIREVRVEDLLGRETVSFDFEAAAVRLTGKKILVTGAGGTIGSELCRQLARVKPASLMMLGRGENRIFAIEQEIKADNPGLELVTVINNLREPERLYKVIARLAPDVVYHTAAHKHVHYMERDPEEAVLNNIAATINLARAVEECGTERFVFISTDKAADPKGVMGATKRLVEMYLSKINPDSACRFMTVRFGNVIGSTGSVVPLFVNQIGRGGPVTVSHPEATRFFMTVKEASLLVIQASVSGKGGETYILDMGEALNILDMARDIILLTGHEPDSEIPIEFTGLREGEKLHEVLIGDDETLEPPEPGEKIMIARSPAATGDTFRADVDGLIEAARTGDRDGVLRLMSEIIPGFGNDPGTGS